MPPYAPTDWGGSLSGFMALGGRSAPTAPGQTICPIRDLYSAPPSCPSPVWWIGPAVSSAASLAGDGEQCPEVLSAGGTHHTAVKVLGTESEWADSEASFNATSINRTFKRVSIFLRAQREVLIDLYTCLSGMSFPNTSDTDHAGS